MSEWDQTADSTLLEEVISVLRRAERPPAGVVAAANTAFGWRSVMTAVADLEFDSAVDEWDLARVRAWTSERHLRFRGAGRVAEMSVIDGGRRLAGRVDPPMTGSVVLRHPGRPDVSAAVDHLGQFLFDSLPRGPMSIRIVPSDPGERGFQTEWVTV